MAAVPGGKKPDPLTPATIRNLHDKLYDKRKLGALEVEQSIKELNKAQDSAKIIEVILYLNDTFLRSTSIGSRKGGLIAMAAAALGLGQDIGKYINQLVPPVLQCFVDHDNKVRYYACESLYNIAKSAKAKILQFFNEIFDDLCKLSADPDQHVRTAADVLDGLIKDIVTEGNIFDVASFIPLLAKRIYVTNTEARKFLVNWLILMDSVPGIELVTHLPQFLDGVFVMLSDASEEIRTVVSAALGEFLDQIKKKSNTVDFGALVEIVIPHCSTSDGYGFITCHTAITWVNEFISIGKDQILPFAHRLLTGILPCISHSSKNVEEIARQANKRLVDLVKETQESVVVKNFLDIIQAQFNNLRVPTRLASLRWVLVLHLKSPSEMLVFLEDLFPALLKALSDNAEDVVRLDLQVLAKLSANEVYFDKLMQSLVGMFRSDRKLLDVRGNLIVRQLSLSIKPEKIYRALALILEPENDTDFASTFIQTLNIILLTSTELVDVRASLKVLTVSGANLGQSNADTQSLFVVLYRSWCHNPMAVFSLCLLAQVYQQASQLVSKFADIEVTVSFLIEIDRLVQLLESPVFIFLRLQLLEPDRYPFLFKALYGLLMLLPQSSAYETLRSRLNSVTSLGVLHLMPKSNDVINPPKEIPFGALLDHFVTVQAKHTDKLRKARLESEFEVSNSALAAGVQTGANSSAPGSLSRGTMTKTGSSASVPASPSSRHTTHIDLSNTNKDEITSFKVHSGPKQQLSSSGTAVPDSKPAFTD